MEINTINPEEMSHKFGLSKKEMYKQIIRFDKIIGKENVVNKKVLEIGAGSGIFSCLMSLYGASYVTSLEPEAQGSTQGVQISFEERMKNLNINNCTLAPLTLQDYETRPKSIDLIVAVSSINHWDEVSCIKLHKDLAAERKYIELFKKCHNYLISEGKFILSDVGRNNFFGKINSITGLKHPFASTVEWHKHQEPKLWKNILEKSGFVNVKWKWTCPPPLKFGLDKIINNYILAYLSASYFVIYADKK